MQVLPKEIVDLTKVRTLRQSRLILADLTSHEDKVLYEAASKLAHCGETEREREQARAFAALLGAVS